MEETFDLIISIVNRGHSDPVVEASREAGAKGGTIIYGRGTGKNETDTFMGVSIQPEKEIIMTLTNTENKNNIMEAICDKASLDTVGMGICFSLPVTKVRGITGKNSNQNAIKKQDTLKQNAENKSNLNK